MAEILELYGVAENLDLLIDEIVFNDRININQESILVELRQDEIVYTEISNLHQNKIEVELLVDEIIYPDILSLNETKIQVDPHIHFFESETLTEQSHGPNLRNNGEQVTFPYPIFTTATGISQTEKLSYSQVAALSSNPRVVVRYGIGAVILGITIDSVYQIDCF